MVFIRASMPTVTPQQGDGQATRTSFRPPWVKEAPAPVTTSAPWARSREARVSRDEGQPRSRDARVSRDEGQPSAISRELTEARERLNAIEGTTKPPIELTPGPPRKLSKITIIPSRPSAEPVENGQQITSIRSQGTVQEQPAQSEGEEPQVKTTPPTSATKPKQPVEVAAKQSSEGNGARTLEQPKKSAPETQPNVVNKSKTQEQPKKSAPETQPNVANKSKTQEQPKKSAPETQPNVANKSKTQEPKKSTTEIQDKKTQPNKSKTQEPKQAAMDLKPAAAKDNIPQKPQQTIPVKERYKDAKPNGPKEKRISIDVPHEKKTTVENEKTIPIVIKTEVSKAPTAPPPPPGPPMPPPPPSMPGIKEKPFAKLKLDKIETLRSRPRKRPDWGTMMKEIESGRKLNHVVCDDRSAPLIATPIKVKEQFMYESEKPNVHNRLLEQIQQGVHLKRVKTNDRSKPILDGLRKFRRQMTIEEQTLKEAEAVVAEPDELDDIDKVRDDLQSTKQMLALELRNKEAMERENKRLQARLLNLEVDLEKEKASKSKQDSPQERRLQEEEENRKLKSELEKAQQMAEEMENKFHDTVGQLEMTRGELEDLQRKNHILERRMSNYACRDGDQPIIKQPSAKKLAKSSSAIAKQAVKPGNAKEEESEEEESEYEEETESEEESSEEEDEAAVQERRTARELKLLSTKIKSFKDKEEAARKERVVLKEQLKKLTATLKEEKKRYKEIQKEVESMASVLKEDEEEDAEEEEEEEESETESESESDVSEEESEEDLPPEAPVEERRKNLTNRSKTHENCLAVLKKGNYMLKANVDRLKDDLFKQKEMAITLQEDLNAVLAELG